MKVTETDFFLIDTSAWLEYLLNPFCEAKDYIDSDNNVLITSVISLHEARKRLIKLKKTEQEIDEAMEFIKENSLILPVNQHIAEKSVFDCIDYGLHTIDSIIYRTAQESEARLITYDNDFDGLNDVLLFHK